MEAERERRLEEERRLEDERVDEKRRLKREDWRMTGGWRNRWRGAEGGGESRGR